MMPGQSRFPLIVNGTLKRRSQVTSIFPSEFLCQKNFPTSYLNGDICSVFLKNTQSYDIVELNSSVLRWLIVLSKVD